MHKLNKIGSVNNLICKQPKKPENSIFSKRCCFLALIV